MGANPNPSICSNCQAETQFINNRAFSSIAQMQKQFKQYADNNMLGLYGRRVQVLIQRLFTLQQFHICDLIVKLTCDKKMQTRDKLLTDIQAVNLEQLDHLILVESVQLSVHSSNMQNASSIYLSQDEENRGLRIIQHKNMQFKDTDGKYEQMLQCQKVVIFATIECFGNTGSLKPLQLPTKRSALQIFIQKVQTVNLVNHCSLSVVFIVNPNFQKAFDEEIDRILKTRDLEQSQDTETSLFDFKFQKILYKPVFPCVDSNRKIQLQKNRLKFNYATGDFIGFLMSQLSIQKFLDKHDYIQMAYINNLTEQIADKSSLLYLNKHTETNIIGFTNEELYMNEIQEYIKLKKSFIESEKYTADKGKFKKNVHSLNKTYYIRSSLFRKSVQNSLFLKLISTKFKFDSIVPNKSKKDEKVITFVRNIDSILYAPFTLLVISQKIEYKPGNKKCQILYSNYCKMRIGLKQTQDDEIVQICPHILFGKKESFKKIVEKLRKLQKIGFPLVINRERTDTFSGITD